MTAADKTKNKMNTAQGPYLLEIQSPSLALPEGYHYGVIVTGPGRNRRWIVRERDGRGCLCPLTPASDEIAYETVAELIALVDDALDAEDRE